MTLEEKYERLSHLIRMASGNVQSEDGFDPELALRYLLERVHVLKQEREAIALLRTYVEVCDALRDAPYPSPDYRKRLDRALDLSREVFAATRRLG